jgi:acetyltransferase-like isoleucine patch superfamily enzyme
MKKAMARIFSRYLVPPFLAAIYYSIRYRCLVSLSARLQLSNRISFGEKTVVKPYAMLLTQGGRISFGKNCAISSFNHISNGSEDIIVGDNVRIGPHVTILGGSRNFKDKSRLIVEQGSHHKGVNIGNDVLIGSNAVILPGCNIGDGAVIGALSLVNNDVPPYRIVAGNPARVIGERE